MMASTGGWDGQDHHMATGGPEDEFGHFLDISSMGDGMGFDFNGFQEGAADGQQHIMAQGDPAMMHDPSAAAPVPSTSAGGHVPSQMTPVSAPNTDTISSIDAQIQYLQQQKFQQQQRQLHEQRTAYFSSQNRSVPPTPQSLEMPPGSGHFYSHGDQMAQDVYERGYHHQQRTREQQDMAFTPLVSPAVTPLDPQFSMENTFAMPGAYFSPLTSPALHAQNDSGSGYDQSTHSNNSPIDMDLEGPSAPVATTLELSKKAKKNNAAKSRSKTSVRSSPIAKPQRKKPGPSPAIVSHVLSEVDEAGGQGGQGGDTAMLPLPAASMDGSDENASVSPENLTDMPPPPVPSWTQGNSSSRNSPFLRPEGGSAPTSNPTTAPSPAWNPTPTATASPAVDGQKHPATPASLMRLPSSKSSKRPATSQHEQTATDNIESLELPESVSKKQFEAPAAPRESPRIQPSTDRPASSRQVPPSPSASSRQVPPSPSASRRPSTASANQSPLMQPGSSGPSARKTPQLAPRMGRKQSTGSAHASPALLPRISPNIKPLLPGGDGKGADASQLLMSKSNYQNILEGNLLPGVTYPSDLSSNLTSKRTSHKIAEQGRRNRINSALHVMAGLLPEEARAEAEDCERKEGKQANSTTSKASVVEKAIVHMKQLTDENSALRKELQELKDQMDKAKAPT